MKAGERQREFNFRQLTAGNELKYNVDVPDDRGNRITFQMVKGAAGEWVTEVPNLPPWIESSQSILSDAIKEHMAEIGTN